MKRFPWAWYLVLCALLLQGSAEWWIKAAFDRNQNYIAQELCKQKDNPLNSCLGQCVLMKKLKEHQTQEEAQTWTAFVWSLPSPSLQSLSIPKHLPIGDAQLPFPISDNATLKGMIPVLMKPPLV